MAEKKKSSKALKKRVNRSGRGSAGPETLHDSAWREQIEKKLISAAEGWRNTFDSISDHISVVDNDFKFVKVNKALAGSLGRKPSELIGEYCYKIIHALKEPIPDCPHREMIKTGKTVTREIYDPVLDQFIMVTVSPVFDHNGTIQGSVHFMKDVTSLKKAEAELKERTMLAELSAELAVSLNQSDTLEHTLKHCTEILVQRLDVSFVRIWTLNTTDNVLELRASSGTYTHIDGAHSRMPLGKYKIGLIAKERKPHLTNTVIGDPSIHDQEWAKREGFVAFAGHPLVLEDKLMGVMALFSQKTLSEVTARALAHVADLIALGIKRKKADHELLAYKTDLEVKVSERTAELSASNLLLKEEIDERREIEQDLIESERKYRDLFNYMSNGVAVYEAVEDGKDFIIKDVNKCGEKIDRLKKEKLIGRRVTEIFPGIKDFGLLNVFKRVWKTGEPENHPVSLYKDRRIAGWRENYVYKLPSGDIVSIYDDVTERKRVEDEAFRVGHLAALGELAAGIAHEINNPMNGIINYAQILLNKSKHDSKDQDIASRIIKEGNRISNIVSSLLSFARIYEVKRRPVHVLEILSDSLALTETLLIKDGITVKRKLPADLPEIIANPQHIEQVFLNIISNARYALNEKFMENNGQKILEITGKKLTLDGSRYTRMIFSDNGTGIPAGTLDKVMNPFFSTKPARHGTGLGLSISHSIITDHGGKLRIQSSEGKSTTVTIDLPAAEKRDSR
jgi:PAS domain S-box-containing protein